MPNYPDPPPDFLEAISNGPNGRRLSTSSNGSISVTPPGAPPPAAPTGVTTPGVPPPNANSSPTSRLPSPSPTPSARSPRRWDDPPEHEPEGPPDNVTTLILVHMRRIQTFATRKEVLRLEFTPTGSFLAVCTAFSPIHQHSNDYRALNFYDGTSWGPVPLPMSPLRVSRDFALSPSQPHVAVPYFTVADNVSSGALKPYLETYDLAQRKKLVKVDQFVPLQAPLAYAPDGVTLAGVSTRDPSRILLVKVHQFPIQMIRLIATHLEEVTQVAFTPDGTSIVSASKDGSLRMTSLASGRTLRKLEIPTTRFNCSMMQVSLDGELVVSIWGREVYLWYPRTGVIRGYNLATVRLTEGWPLAISPDCKYLACRTEEGFDVANVEDGKFRGDFVAESTLITAAAFSHNSKYMAVGKYTGEVHLFELVT